MQLSAAPLEDSHQSETRRFTVSALATVAGWSPLPLSFA